MPSNPQNGTHFRTCNLCEAVCGIAIDVHQGEIQKIYGDKSDPFSRGHICPKAVALQDVYHDPDRLRQPVKRTANGWQAISWDEAFEEVTEKLLETQNQYGNNAVAVYQGNPTVHNYGTLFFAPYFFKALRTKNRYAATSVDQLAHHFASYFMFGNQLLLPVPDIDRTNYFLILGANPLVSNGSLMTAPGIGRRLKELQQRGGQFVVIDPRRTETAKVADAHHFIKPGTDVLFLLGLLHTICEEHLAAPGRLSSFTDGIENIRGLVADFSPETTSGLTCMEADTVRQIARDFCAAGAAVCYGRMGVSTQQFGGLCQWLINVINVVTGNLDREGGAMFTQPAVDIVKQASRDGTGGHYNWWQSRVSGVPEFGGEFPVSVLAEEMLTPGDGQVRALITSAGNPVLSTPNGTKLEKGLKGLDFMVSIDIYRNETTRFANIILPPATGLETPHYDLAFYMLGVRNMAKYSPALYSRADGSKFDWEIFQELRKGIERNRPAAGLSQKFNRLFLKYMTADRLLDLGLRLGNYGSLGGRIFSGAGLRLSKLKSNVHGLDLGALQPCLPGRLFNAEKSIQLTPDVFFEDIDRVRQTYFKNQSTELLNQTTETLGQPPTKSPAKSSELNLLLIGRRSLRSNNSWMHNSHRLVKGKSRCTLIMHPTDADDRGLENGSSVSVVSNTGAVEIELQLSEEMMQGVVSIPHGWGHHRKDMQLTTAFNNPGISINDLTDDKLTDELSGASVLNGVPVKVLPLSAERTPITSQHSADVQSK